MIALDRLISCARGELSGDAEQEVEEHVLSCSRCALRYASFLRLGPAIAELVRGGGVTMPVTRALAERLDAEGLISRRYELEPGTAVPCTVGPDDVYSLTTYHVDLAGVSRVDLVRFGQRVPDIPFDADAGRVYMLTRAEVLRTLPTMRVPLQLVAVEAEGERTLGDYVLDHTAPS
jgi:hypothetical protein